MIITVSGYRDFRIKLLIFVVVFVVVVLFCCFLFFVSFDNVITDCFLCRLLHIDVLLTIILKVSVFLNQ